MFSSVRGFDSYAYRHPELLATLTIFEVDHPLSQQWKPAARRRQQHRRAIR
jgi:O-methyltransferase involved in polyketide biosynthesis